MDRRRFLAGVAIATAASGVWRSLPAWADVSHLRPLSTPAGPKPVTRAYVGHPKRVIEDCPSLCWAAAANMVFAFYEHRVDQKTVIDTLFPGGGCGPAPAPAAMAVALTREWTDIAGRCFGSRVTSIYDGEGHASPVNMTIIVDALTNDHPLLYSNKQRAMVIVKADFTTEPSGPDIFSIGVLDPWSGAQGYHTLSEAEMTPADKGGELTFLGTVEVD